MTGWQRETFAEFLALHPKNTIQAVSARNTWAEKVTDEAVEGWLLDCLRREVKGDTTYMLGPGKWLREHLELYAAGVQPQQQNPAAPSDQYARRSQRASEVFDELVADRIANAKTDDVQQDGSSEGERTAPNPRLLSA